MGIDHEAMFAREGVAQGLYDLGQQLGLSPAEVRKRAEQSLGEMWTSHEPVVSNAWRGFGRLITQRYELKSNPEALARIRALDDEHPLLFLFSHRSYLDEFTIQRAVMGGGISPFHTLAGANLNFIPIGPVIRRSGGLFIRRNSKDDPIYRFVLRNYIAHLMYERHNLGWSIEGGRTRTGKLRPPRLGALRYVVDAARTGEGPEVFIVPTSVVYDQLSEVATMAAEAVGQDKQPEDIEWLARFAMKQLNRGGTVHVDVGEPIPLRERIAELDRADEGQPRTVERVAIEVCHGINRVTPATPTAVVAVALLGEERALTLEETRASVRPILAYLTSHLHLPTSFRAAQGDGWISRTLEELVQSGVVECYRGGPEPVYRVADQQHLVAAFYRNTLIHLLATRAIGELALFIVRDRKGDLRHEIQREAVRLRDLLKFELFFSRRSAFLVELGAELAYIDPDWEGRFAREPVITRQRLGIWFERTRPHFAHLVLRPFIDAYLIVATALLSWPAGEPVDEAVLLKRCLGLGQQWVLQKRLHSAESVTLELFRTGLQLARHRTLLEADEEVGERREAFADELRWIVESLEALSASERRGEQ